MASEQTPQGYPRPGLAGAQSADRVIAGRYELLDVIGRGGMGVVHRARDLRLNREVAVKFLREHISVEVAVKRFCFEAQITGQLQHPGIPAVHDLGELADGRPYLAMKLVKGRTLHELLQEQVEPSQARGRFIAIFEQVCHAVGYAHSHNVIHRDLKPGNVMVGAHGEVQVMDWGLAKVLGATQPPERADGPRALPARDTDGLWDGRNWPPPPDDPHELPPTVAFVTAIEATEGTDLFTRIGSVLGTPAYMPPEQAAGEIGKLDARSDVFGLGAILCEILTGRPPYEGQTANELRVKAAEGQLQAAWARLDSCGAEPELIALCKRCLAFHPADRPANGETVAAEVAALRQAAEERARQAETERARAETRAAEQAKRRRVWIALAASLLVGLAASLALTAWAMRAERIASAERDAKEQALQAEKQALAEKTAALQAERLARELAEKRRLQAERNLAYAKKGNELLGSVFSGLDPKAVYATIAEFRNALKANLDKAVQELEGEAIGDLLTVAEMQNTLALSLLGLGEYAQAIVLLQKSRETRALQLGPDHPDTLQSMNNIALAYQEAGKLELALPLYEEALRRRKAKFGPDHPDTLQSVNNLALGYQLAGKLDLALPLLEETLRRRRDQLGPGHPDTLQSMNNLALGYQAAGRLDLALPVYEETLWLRRAKLGPDHPDTLQSMNNLAGAYKAADKLDLALPLYEETLRLRKAKLGADHPDTLTSMNNLAFAYQSTRKLDQAILLYEEALPLMQAKLGADHPNTLTVMNNLALGYEAAGKLDQALRLYEETLRRMQTKLGPDHPDTLTGMNNLALGYQAAGKLDLALRLFHEAAVGMQKRRFQHPYAGRIVGNLIDGYECLKQFDQAEVWRRQWLAVLKERGESDSLAYAVELAALGLNLLQQKKWSDAETVLRECLAIRKKQQPDAWTTFNTQSMLGGALLGRALGSGDEPGRAALLAEAEPLLLEGFAGLKARQETIPPSAATRIPEALDRLIELYTALNKPAEIKKYRQLRRHYADGLQPM